MRHLKNNSTKAERRVYEILKELRIPFKHRWLVGKTEIDFVICNKYAIEIDGHKQNESKNGVLISLGYVPIHISNKEIKNNREKIKNIFKELCLLQGQNFRD